MMPKVFTVGHGTRTIEGLIDVLAGAGIEVVVDVRRYPGSRRHPHFARDALERSLPAEGIAYEWAGEVFGGRRSPLPESPNIAWRVDAFRGYADHMSSPDFRAALDALEEKADDTRQCVMCAETLWWRCHRRLIADALVADGLEVIHLGMGKGGVGKDGVHPLNEAARRDERGTLIYDVGVTPPLQM